ncbi:unnamed protein product [Arctogadus glacialis]
MSITHSLYALSSLPPKAMSLPLSPPKTCLSLSPPPKTCLSLSPPQRHASPSLPPKDMPLPLSPPKAMSVFHTQLFLGLFSGLGFTFPPMLSYHI